MKKSKITKAAFFLLLTTCFILIPNSQAQWNVIYNNEQMNPGIGYIGVYPLSNFNVRKTDYFTNPYNDQYKILFSNGSTVNLINYGFPSHSCSPQNGWCTYWSGNNSIINAATRFYTIGMYVYNFNNYLDNTNFLLVINDNTNWAYILAPPYEPYTHSWNYIWTNNGNGKIGNPSWDVDINTTNFLPGNFNTQEWREGNSTGKEVLCITKFWNGEENDGYLNLLNFNYDWQTNSATWSRVWNNIYGFIAGWDIVGGVDRYEVADFDGGYKDELLIYNQGYSPTLQHKRAKLLKFQNGNWVTVWDNNRSGWIGNWQIPIPSPGYNTYVGRLCINFPCYTRDQLLTIEKSTGKLLLQQYSIQGGSWDLIYSNSGTPYCFGNYGNCQWTININDKFQVGGYGHFLEDKRTVLATSQSGRAKILGYLTSAGGCPWISVYNGDTTGGYLLDNNILHRSEFQEYIGQDIKDLYKLNINPVPINDKLSIMVGETENDYDYFDQLKLYAVDHPVGTKVGVTESNDIVMYDDGSVQSTDDASLNGTTNITSLIQYNAQGKKVLTGNKGDSIYAHFDESEQLRAIGYIRKKYQEFGDNSTVDSIALIGEIGDGDRIWFPSPAKDYAGDVVVYTNADSYQRKFSRRELSSVVIVPFAGESADAVDHIDVNWFSDYKVTYFSVVPIMYSGFDITELNLAEAEHSVIGDVKTLLTSIDNNYSELDSTAIITLKFNVIAPSKQVT